MNFLYLKMLKEDTNIFDGAMRMEWFSRRPDIKSEHFKLVPDSWPLCCAKFKIAPFFKSPDQSWSSQEMCEIYFSRHRINTPIFLELYSKFCQAEENLIKFKQRRGRDTCASWPLSWACLDRGALALVMTSHAAPATDTCPVHTVPGKQPWSDAGIQS